MNHKTMHDCSATTALHAHGTDSATWNQQAGEGGGSQTRKRRVGGGGGKKPLLHLVHQARVDDKASGGAVFKCLAPIQERGNALAAPSVTHRQHTVRNCT